MPKKDNSNNSALLYISVVIPVFNESLILPRLFTHLRKIQAQKIVFVDGGSQDDTVAQIQYFIKQYSGQVELLHTQASRSTQMNAALLAIHSDWILFLHADSYLPITYRQVIHRAQVNGCNWGRFDVRFEKTQSTHIMIPIIAFCMNLRSRITGIATGDQGIFVRRQAFINVGQYPNISLMEDIAMSKKLKKQGRGFFAHDKITTSARRWLANGVFKTILLMWSFRVLYFLGVPASVLAGWYIKVR